MLQAVITLVYWVLCSIVLCSMLQELIALVYYLLCSNAFFAVLQAVIALVYCVWCAYSNVLCAMLQAVIALVYCVWYTFSIQLRFSNVRKKFPKLSEKICKSLQSFAKENLQMFPKLSKRFQVRPTLNVYPNDARCLYNYLIPIGDHVQRKKVLILV